MRYCNIVKKTGLKYTHRIGKAGVRKRIKEKHSLGTSCRREVEKSKREISMSYIIYIIFPLPPIYTFFVPTYVV